MEKKIHFVSFDIPYPPNYGGIIDVYYKIKELSKLEVKIYLHCFAQKNAKKQIELEKICEKVFYYDRNNFFYSLFSLLPFRVKSRSNHLLINNLKAIQAPILFEGLQSTYPIYKENFENCYVRAHNIEHTYFYGLAKSEKNIFLKIFFYIEGKKLYKYERIVKKATGIFTISPFEQHYFNQKYGEKSTYIPVFFDENKNNFHVSETQKFILYHGDLRVSDNVRAALFLIETYKKTNYQFIVASNCKHKKIISEIQKYRNITFEDIPNQKDLEILLNKAHINTLISFQKTGIKLKLLNALFKGKHIIGNSKMIEDTGLENLCELANSKEEILAKTAMLFNKDFSASEIEDRSDKLTFLQPEQSAKKIIDIVFKQ